MPVIDSPELAILARRYHDLDAASLQSIHEFLTVVSFVGDSRISFEASRQFWSNCNIRLGTCCDNDSDRHTMRIHGQMNLGVEPPFVRPIASLPPFAPQACRCALIWVASIMSHSKSGSSSTTSSSRSQIPLSRQRQNRRWVFFQSPNSGGRSRQGAPVRRIQTTALMNRRLSLATPPQSPFFPGRWGPIISQERSLMSWRCKALSIGIPPSQLIPERIRKSPAIVNTRDDTP